MQLLVGQFESLLDKALEQQHGGSDSWGSSLDAVGGDGGEARGARALSLLSCRSLSAGFWALGNMRHPLSQEMMDKLAGEA